MPLLGPGIPPPPNQQLPPQMFTTAAQLLDMTDSKDFLVVTFRVPLEAEVFLSQPFASTACFAESQSSALYYMGSLCGEKVWLT
jgi:hypothetical protein